MVREHLGKFFLTMGIVLFFTFLLSHFLGMVRGGFDVAEALNVQTWYLIAIAFAVGIVCFMIYQVAITKKDAKYGYSVGFASLGEKPHLSFFKRFTIFQLFLLSVIIFGAIGLVNTTMAPQTSYTGVGFLVQEEFTPIDSMLYSALLIPGAENIGCALVIAFVLVMIGIWARKTNMSAATFAILAILLVTIIGGLFGIGNHLLRYRGFETTLLTVGIFWALGSFLIAITGSFIPFWVMHIMNNLFLDLQRFFTSETIFIFAIFVLLSFVVLYFLLYRGRLLGESKRG